MINTKLKKLKAYEVGQILRPYSPANMKVIDIVKEYTMIAGTVIETKENTQEDIIRYLSKRNEENAYGYREINFQRLEYYLINDEVYLYSFNVYKDLNILKQIIIYTCPTEK